MAIHYSKTATSMHGAMFSFVFEFPSLTHSLQSTKYLCIIAKMKGIRGRGSLVYKYLIVALGRKRKNILLTRWSAL